MKCQDCDSSPAKRTIYANAILCESCESIMADLQKLRYKEEREEIAKIVQGKQWEPSLAFSLWIESLHKSGSTVLSEEKIPDYLNTNVLPLVALMSDEEVGRAFVIIKEQYFYLQATLGMRKVDRFREAEVIKKSQKVARTRDKATTEIAKQKKHASKDRTLSKEERGRAKVIEGLVAMGMSEADAERMIKAK